MLWNTRCSRLQLVDAVLAGAGNFSSLIHHLVSTRSSPTWTATHSSTSTSSKALTFGVFESSLPAYKFPFLFLKVYYYEGII